MKHTHVYLTVDQQRRMHGMDSGCCNYERSGRKKDQRNEDTYSIAFLKLQLLNRIFKFTDRSRSRHLLHNVYMAWANVTSGPSGDDDDSVILSPQNSSVGGLLLDNSGFFCCCNVSYKFTFKTEMTLCTSTGHLP